MLSRFCLSLGMESDSVFHDLFPGMQPMPVLQNGLPIPSLNALPVHRANQVWYPLHLCGKMHVLQRGAVWIYMEIHVFPTGYPLDSSGNMHILQGGMVRICMKTCVFPIGHRLD